MEKSIFSFIYRYSKRQQLIVLVFTLISFPFLYYSLDLPKNIIDQAIGGSIDFPTQFVRIDAFGFPGFELGQVPYLFTLCGLYLLLVVVNGAFKYYLNTYRGRLGEQMLRRLRYTLFTRVLRFRLPQFKKMSQGEIIPMVTAEVEPLGGYIADAFALPAYQGGTLLVYLFFIFLQDPILGAAAISLYPIQAIIIPRLQRRVNQLGKERVRTMRVLSDRIGETISNAEAVHANNTAKLHMSQVSSILGTVYHIRYEIFQRKFFIKFLNNFLNQLTPFFFYSVGGYLVLQGSLSFGSLVAVLAAYKDLAGPWRELLNYYQRTEDARIKYDQVVEQFQPEDIMPAEQIDADDVPDGPLGDAFSLSNVTFGEEDRVPIFVGLSLDIPAHKHVAVLGGGASGRLELLQLLARLVVPQAGRIRLGERDLATLPEAVTGRQISYVGPQPFLFSDTIEANLLYGLKHRAIEELDREGDAAMHRRRAIADALSTGNIDMDFDGEWIDYGALGLTGPEALREHLVEILSIVALDADVYQLGLVGTIDPGEDPEFAEQILAARKRIAERLQEEAFAKLVERFDTESFNESATVAENLLFGTPKGGAFSPEALPRNAHVLDVLRKVDLLDTFLTMGVSVAETMIELFADLPAGHPFFEQFSFISSDELPEFQPLIAKAKRDDGKELTDEEKARFMALPFMLIPSRHRLGVIDEALQDKILKGRKLFAETLPEELKDAVEFFNPETYNAAATLQDNILFGKIRYGQASASEMVNELVTDVINQLNLRSVIIEAGLSHSVGVSGGRLSAQQRQKVALGRALLKDPEVLILYEATGSLDAGEQVRVARRVRELRDGRGLIWAPEQPQIASGFDEVIVLEDGRVAERGDYDSLKNGDGPLQSMLAAE